MHARIFLNSMPKSGTNLVSRAFDLAGVRYDKLGIAATLTIGNYYYPRQLMRRSFFEKNPINIGLESQVPIRRSWLKNRLSKVPHRNYITGHVNWSQGIENILQENEFKTVLVIRDPIDTLVSYCHYIGSQESHFLHAAYKKLELKDKIITALNGGHLAGFDVAPFTSMLHLIDKWLERPGVLLIRFEDIIGFKGGGSNEKQLKCLNELSDFTDFDFNNHRVRSNLFGQSHTFRKGQIGSAKNELTPDLYSDLIRRLKYHRKNWGYLDSQ